MCNQHRTGLFTMIIMINEYPPDNDIMLIIKTVGFFIGAMLFLSPDFGWFK